MQAALAQIQIWTDPQCASGVPKAFVQKVLSASATLRLRGDSRVSWSCPLDDAAIAEITAGRVARLIYADGTFEEWRIDRLTTEASAKGEVRMVDCASMLYELGAGRPITEYDTFGVPSFAGFRYQITPSDVITDLVLTQLATDGRTWVALGTIDPTALIDIEWADVTPLGLLHQLEELTGAELQLRRNGTTSYLIDLRTEINSSQPVADLRESKNLIGTALTEDATQRYSEIVGLGASDPAGRRATIGRAVWEVSAVNTTTDLITLVDPEGGADPIVENDQLNGHYLYALNAGTTTLILDSTASPCQVQVADASPFTVGDLLEVRDSAGTGTYKDDAQLLTSLTRPSITPARTGVLDAPQYAGERNLLPNGWFSDWTGGANAAPDSWTLEWNVYGAQDTTYADLGTYSLALRYLPYEASATPLTSGGTVITGLSDTSGFATNMPVEVRGNNSFTWDSRTVASKTATSVTINSGVSYAHAGGTIIQGKGPGATIGTPRVYSGSVRAPTTGGTIFWAQAKIFATGLPAGQYLVTLWIEHLNSGGLVLKRFVSSTNILDQWVVLGLSTQAAAGEYLRVGVDLAQDPASLTIVQPGTLTSSHAVYIDGISLTHTDYQPAGIPNYSFGNAFWHAVNRKLLADGANASYDVDLIDLTALDAAGWPNDELLLGGTVRVNQNRTGYTNTLLRIVELVRPDLFKPAQATVVLNARRPDLTELIDQAVAAAVGRASPPSTIPGGSTPGGTPLPPPPPPSLPPGSPPPPAPLALPLLKTIIDSGSRYTLTDFPSALSDLFHGGEFLADLTSIPNAFLTGHIHTSAACPGEMRLQYLRTTDGTWRYLDGTGGPALPLLNSGRATGTSVTLETDARGPRWCKVVGISGNDTADPIVGHLTLHGGVATSAVLGDWLELIQQLGGDAAVPFFYDGRFNTTSYTGGKISAIDDVRGASGYGPTLTSGSAGDYPLYDSTNGELQFASGQALVSAAESALVDLTGPFTLVYVGTATSGGGGRKYLAAVGSPTTTATTVLGVRTDGATIIGEALASATRTTLDTTVAVSSTAVRVAIVGQDGGTAMTAQAPNASQVTGALAGAMTATTAHICLMEQSNNDVGNRGIGSVRAFFAVNHALTTTEINAVQAWAVLRRGAATA